MHDTGECEVGSTTDARDVDLDNPAEDTSNGSDDSDYDSDFSEEDRASRTSGGGGDRSD